MDNGLIPHRYARALYKFALEHGSAGTVYEEMKQVIASFQTDPRLSKVLANPFVGNSEKYELLKAAAGEKVENDFLGFVKMILENRREEYALKMALAYRDIYRKANKISQVKIITAVRLPEAEMNRLRTLVSDSFKDTKLEFSEQINPDIIGGFIIDVDDSRMDASISNELEQLRLNLLSH